jgi:hypothetical protein
VNGSGLTANFGNYTFHQAAGNAAALTIDPALLLYTANTASRTYGLSNPALSGTVTGFVNGDSHVTATTGTLSFSTAATTASNVGSYAITGSGLTVVGGNYVLQQAAGNATALTINPATLSYAANSAERTYGASNPAFSGTVTGFVNGDTEATATAGTLSFTSPATAASNVGSYAVNGSGLTAISGNYTFQQATANATALTINPATLTFVADDASRVYGDDNPGFSGTVTGFVNGDSLAGATSGTLTFTSGASPTSDVGNYAIDGGGLTANHGNYVFAQASSNGTALSIAPYHLTASLTGTVSKSFDTTDQAALAADNYVLSPTRNGDVVTLDAPSVGTYASNMVGTDIPVTVSGLHLAGPKAGDYVLASSILTADIGEIQPAATSSRAVLSFVSILPSAGAEDLMLLGDTSGLGPMPGILSAPEAAAGDSIRVSLDLPMITEPDQALMQSHRGKKRVIKLPPPDITRHLSY